MAIKTFWLKDPSDDGGGRIYYFKCLAKHDYRERYCEKYPEPEQDPKGYYQNSDHDVWQRNYLTWLRNNPSVKEVTLGQL